MPAEAIGYTLEDNQMDLDPPNNACFLCSCMAHLIQSRYFMNNASFTLIVHLVSHHSDDVRDYYDLCSYDNIMCDDGMTCLFVDLCVCASTVCVPPRFQLVFECQFLNILCQPNPVQPQFSKL